MNYSEIKALALGYADREDAETIARIDDFIRMAEAKINRELKIRKMSVRSQVPVIEDQEYYGLPSDFAGIRHIEFQNPTKGPALSVMSLVTPEGMAEAINSNIFKLLPTTTGLKTIYYTIVADQFRVYPPQKSGLIEILYYKKVPNLNTTNPDNWLSDLSPDVYVFGLLVEIGAFTKDSEAMSLWNSRFLAAINDLKVDDKDERWSGPPMQIRVI